MVCPNCNTTIESGNVFCKNCGSKFVFTMTESGVKVHTINNEQNNDSNLTQNFQERNIENNMNESQNKQDNINFNNLIDAYIGKNADKLKSGFSFCALFFGVLYVFYRKMWLLGFVWLLLNICLSIFLPKLVLLGLFINIFVSICFKKLYINHVSDRVTKIKTQYSNLSNSELVSVCSKKGGTTIVPIIIMILISGLITLIATKIVLGILDESRKNTNKIFAQYIVDTVEKSYNISYTQNLGEFPTVDQIKNNFKINGVIWNNDNTITSTTDATICKILINSEKRMTVECDVGEEKIVSSTMEVSVGENNNLNENISKNERNDIIQSVEYIFDAVELAYSKAYLKNSGQSITIDSVKNEFDFYTYANWNVDNTITSNMDATICKVLVNLENQMTVECDANGEKIVSEQMNLG